jgi:hypothetical protein
MDGPERNRLSREAAEALLSGDVGAMSATDEPTAAAAVADLLTRARGPAWLDEHAGEEVAAAAFRAARDAPARTIPARYRPAGIRPALTRILSVKVLAVAIATTVGGVALTTATMPGGWLPGRHGTTPQSPTSTRPASGGPAGSPTASLGNPAPGTGTPSRAIRDLCRAYLALSGGEATDALHRAEFAPLVRTAGGERSVQTYCVGLLGGAPTALSSGGPSGSAGPTAAMGRNEVANCRRNGTMSRQSADRLTAILRPLLAGDHTEPEPTTRDGRRSPG